jgi:hypothetical protein
VQSEQGSHSGVGGGRRSNDDYYNNNNNNNNNSEQGTYGKYCCFMGEIETNMNVWCTANDNSPPHRIASSQSRRTERSDYPPSLPRSDFPSFENHAGASMRAPPASSRGERNLKEGEVEEHVRMDGQTNAPGEMPRGVGSEDGGLESEMGSRRDEGGSGGEGGMETDVHPWYPRTTKFRGEKTRRR